MAGCRSETRSEPNGKIGYVTLIMNLRDFEYVSRFLYDLIRFDRRTNLFQKVKTFSDAVIQLLRRTCCFSLHCRIITRSNGQLGLIYQNRVRPPLLDVAVR